MAEITLDELFSDLSPEEFESLSILFLRKPKETLASLQRLVKQEIIAK